MHNAKREPRRGSRLAAPGRLSTLAACALLALLTAAPARANTAEPMVPFFTLKETAEKLLPGAENLTRRDIELSADKRRELEKNKNWNSEEDAYILYHQKNAEKKITRTLVLFPEASRQGTLVVAVALDNHGRRARQRSAAPHRAVASAPRPPGIHGPLHRPGAGDGPEERRPPQGRRAAHLQNLRPAHRQRREKIRPALSRLFRPLLRGPPGNKPNRLEKTAVPRWAIGPAGKFAYKSGGKVVT